MIRLKVKQLHAWDNGPLVWYRALSSAVRPVTSSYPHQLLIHTARLLSGEQKGVIIIIPSAVLLTCFS
jgi:hypothetical protein